MRTLTLTLTVLLAASILPAHSSVALHGGCWSETMQAGDAIKSIVNNASDIHALRASTTIRREAAAALRGAVHVFHAVSSLNMRIERNPQLITQPAVAHMFCLSSRALKDYEGALIVDLRAGRRILARRAAGGRHDVALGSHGVGPSASGQTSAQRDVNITHDVEHSNSLERSHSVTQTRTRERQYESSADASMSRENTLSRNYDTQATAGATEGATYTRQRAMLASPDAPPPGSRRAFREGERWDKAHGVFNRLPPRNDKQLDSAWARAHGLFDVPPLPPEIAARVGTSFRERIKWDEDHGVIQTPPQTIQMAGGGAQEQGSRGRHWVRRWAARHGMGGMAPPSASQVRRLVRHTSAAAAAARTSARGDAQAQAQVRAQIQRQRSSIPPVPRGQE